MSVPLLIAGGLPVYLAARLNLLTGILIYLLVSIISALMDIGAALYFICTAGIASLSLGIARSRSRKLRLVPIPSAILVFSMLAVLNYHFGIRILGDNNRWTILMQALVLIPFLYLSCYLYLSLLMLAEKLILGDRGHDSY